jgi:hypothetical protein
MGQRILDLGDCGGIGRGYGVNLLPPPCNGGALPTSYAPNLKKEIKRNPDQLLQEEVVRVSQQNAFHVNLSAPYSCHRRCTYTAYERKISFTTNIIEINYVF